MITLLRWFGAGFCTQPSVATSPVEPPLSERTVSDSSPDPNRLLSCVPRAVLRWVILHLQKEDNRRELWNSGIVPITSLSGAMPCEIALEDQASYDTLGLDLLLLALEKTEFRVDEESLVQLKTIEFGN